MELELSKGYEALNARARMLLQETRFVHGLQQQETATPHAGSHIQDLKALTDGRISAVVSARPPQSARVVARTMEADPGQALDMAIGDLADVVRWLRNQPSRADNDSIREALARRVRALVAALPDSLHQQPLTALMHVEHEELQRVYVNSETMYGDAVVDVPRENFWASEDGYAWDMEELATGIASNGGVMRNPLSRQMFAPDDVRAIVQHPLGRRLAALQI
jgi:hypothetical protein